MKTKKEMKQEYLDNLRLLLNQTYLHLKEHGVMSQEGKAYIEGYVTAGVSMTVATHKEIAVVMEEENNKVFGSGDKPAKESLRASVVSNKEETYLEVPTL